MNSPLAPADLLRDVSRRRTFAIISHPDAGKTTLTEKLLLFGGAIQLAGTIKARKSAPFRETIPLARAIEKVVERHGRRHPATQVFQALRMEVNDELGALTEGLRVLTGRLETGGRIAVITFHSLEDRIVKNFFRDRSREWLDRPEWPAPRRNPENDLKLITTKPVEPGEDERRANPRSRSAKLRVAEKIA